MDENDPDFDQEMFNNLKKSLDEQIHQEMVKDKLKGLTKAKQEQTK